MPAGAVIDFHLFCLLVGVVPDTHEIAPDAKL
jgi:hypothetical protein